MILLFFPPVRISAVKAIRASIKIHVNYFGEIPAGTLCFLVAINMQSSTEVLPIMSIHTLISSVICFVKRTPNRLVVEHVKIRVSFHLVQQINFDIAFRMCKATTLSIFAVSNAVRVRCTKFRFILCSVIELFDPIMCIWTAVSIWTLLFI